MLVFFQIIFCALKDLLSLAFSEDTRESYECKDEDHHGSTPKEYHGPSCVLGSKNCCAADVNSSAAVKNSCDAMYLELISSKNPLVPKEFLQSLEKKSAQLTIIASKTKTSENNEAPSAQDKATRVQDFVNEIQLEEQIVLNNSDVSYPDVQESNEITCAEQQRLNNCLSDRDWLDELQYLFTADAKDDLKIMLTRSFSETKDPFDFVLFVMLYAEHDIFSGKNSLTHIMLAEFETWIAKRTEGKTKKELQDLGLIASQEQQDNAFEIVVTSKLLFFEPIRRIFKLDCSNNGFLEKHIRYLLHTGRRYKEAATFITKLNLQTHFEPTEILLPLLIQDKLQLAESYVMSCPWQQRAYLSMLDKLCGMNDDELQEIVDSANIHPKPKENKLKNKILIKIAERLVKKFHLNGEDFPNVYKEKNLNGLRYLLHKKYTEKNKSSKKWDNLIEVSDWSLTTCIGNGPAKSGGGPRIFELLGVGYQSNGVVYKGEFTNMGPSDLKIGKIYDGDVNRKYK